MSRRGLGRNLMPIVAAAPGALNVGWSSGAAQEFLFSERASINAVEGFGQVVCSRSGATATCFNRSGVLETVPANVPRLNFDPATLRYENQFINADAINGAGWVRSNTTVSPNPYPTADKVIATAVSGEHLFQQTFTATVGSPSTVIARLQAAEIGFALVGFSGGGVGDVYVGINLSTGAVVSTAGSPNSYTVTDEGGGVWRISCTKTIASAAAVAGRVWLSQNGSTVIFTGDGVGGIFCHGVQLNSGATALEYSRTGATAKAKEYACRGLLVEEGRENKRTYSSQFDNGAWIKSGLTVSPDAASAPDGTASMDKLVESALNEVHRIDGNDVSMTSGTAYTFSVFAKASERSVLQLTVDGSALPATHANFDLSSGTVSATGSSITASIQAVGNGIYRCIATVTATATATANTGYWVIANSTTMARFTAYAGDGSSGLYVWGDQFEAGAFATSYIPTTSTAVTRNADAVTVGGVGQWFNAAEGTVVCEFDGPGISTDAAVRIPWSIGDSTTFNETLYLSRDASSTNVRVAVIDGGVSQISPSLAGTLGSGTFKCAFTYATNDFAWSANGAVASTDGTGSLPTVNTVALGKATWNNANHLCGHIRRFAYFRTREANAYLQALTA